MLRFVVRYGISNIDRMSTLVGYKIGTDIGAPEVSTKWSSNWIQKDPGANWTSNGFIGEFINFFVMYFFWEFPIKVEFNANGGSI